MLLKTAEQRYGLIASMADCLRDPRQVGKADHSLRDLFLQCVFFIGCGYRPGRKAEARFSQSSRLKFAGAACTEWAESRLPVVDR